MEGACRDPKRIGHRFTQITQIKKTPDFLGSYLRLPRKSVADLSA